MAVGKLSDLEIKTAKAVDGITKLSDGGGLQLWVHPDGAKRWRLAYRFNGPQKTLALGVYPTVSLKAAREAREAAKALLAEGIDPSQKRRVDRIAKVASDANTFRHVAEELLTKAQREGRAENTLNKMRWLLEKLACPNLGDRPLADISPPEILEVLRGVERRGNLETARRLRAIIGQVFRYGVATARCTGDPTKDLLGALSLRRSRIVLPSLTR